MNTDIRVAISFKNHRKRKRLKSLLGDSGVIALIDLWLGVAASRPSGVLDGWDAVDISLEAGWEGDPNEFMSALIECKFLDHCDGVLCLHDWDRHQGWVVGAEARSEKARNAAISRWEKRNGRKGEKQGDATSINEQSDEHNSSNAPSPNPSPNPSPKERGGKNEGKAPRFIPPTIDQVTAYCKERKNNIDPELFLSSNESKGWMIGKNKMKCWKSAVRTWELRDKKNKQGESEWE